MSDVDAVGTTMHAAVGAEKPTHQRVFLGLTLLFVIFFYYYDRANVSVLVANSQFLTDMGIVDQSVQKGLIVTVFLVAYMFGNVLLAPLGDVFGPKKMILVSVVTWCLSLVVGGLAPTFFVLLISRVLLGITEGMHFPMQSKFIKQWFPPNERGKANSAWQAGMALAPAVAMPICTWVVSHFGWHDSFFFITAVGIVPLAMVWFLTADTPRQHKWVNKSELDYIESSLEAERRREKSDGATSLMDRIKTFVGDYRFWLIVVYYAAHTSVIWGAMTWLPTYLRMARGFSWGAMGLLASAPWVFGLVTKILSGVLADRFGRRAPLLLIAMLGVACGIYFGAMASNNYVSAIILAFGVGAVGFGGPAAWTLMQDIVPNKGCATAAGVMNGVGNGLAALAPVSIGALIAVAGSYAAGLFYLVGICCVGAVASLVLTLKKY